MNYMVHVFSAMWRIKNKPLTSFLIVTMLYACCFLWWAYYIEDCKWCLHFQFGIAFWRVIMREVYFEGPNHVWRALNTSILTTNYQASKCRKKPSKWASTLFLTRYLGIVFGTNGEFNRKITQISINPAQPEWKSNNNGHLWPILPCNDSVTPGYNKAIDTPPQKKIKSNLVRMSWWATSGVFSKSPSIRSSGTTFISCKIGVYYTSQIDELAWSWQLKLKLANNIVGLVSHLVHIMYC